MSYLSTYMSPTNLDRTVFFFQAATIFKDADPGKLGIVSRAAFARCLELAGIRLSIHELDDMAEKFGVKNGENYCILFSSGSL